MAKSVSRAYEQIKSMILGGEFLPGERLPEKALVEKLGVSRTPVREALRKLNSEGLVLFEPNRGARVQEIAQADMEDLFTLAITLEEFAATLAAKKATQEDIDQLEDIQKQIDELVSDMNEDKVSRFSELDYLFHFQLVRCSRNRLLENMVSQLMSLSGLTKIYRYYKPDHFYRSSHQHREILAAIKAGNPDLAGSAVRNHILSSKHYLSST